MTDNRDDLLWLGASLCRAKDRAAAAERRVVELEEVEAAALVVLEAARPIAGQLPPALNDKLAYLNMVAVIRPALRTPQDAPEPPTLPDPGPARPEALEGSQAPCRCPVCQRIPSANCPFDPRVKLPDP